MSYPGFINGREILGPPLPPALLLSRLANAKSEEGDLPRQHNLVERPKGGLVQHSSTSPVQSDVAKCTTCNNLELRKPSDERHLPSGTKLIFTAAIQVTAASGCAACRTLLEGINRSDVSLRNINHVSLNTLNANSTIVMGIGNNAAWKDNTYLEFYTKSDTPAKWPAVGAGRDVSHDSSSDDCFELARTWLRECIETHPACRRSWSRYRKLPTRLLHVGSDASTPKLVVTDQLRDTKYLKYAALSHCWGPSKPIVTERISIGDRMAGIPFSDLPKTFQDAFTVARKLEIEYLWIDSLCILQDSKEDWAQEAEHMATVYANAILTIAADASPDAHGGLFVAGEGRPKPISIKCPGPNGSQSHVYVRPHGIRRVVNEVSHSYVKEARSKLTTRGWVLQERLLSTRTLHYTENEMAWECSSCLRCECAVNAEEASVHCFKQRYILKNSVEDYGDKAGQGFSNSLEKTPEWERRVKEKREGAPIILLNWHNVVWEYTARQLTYQSDRLPALSGLAATMERATSNMFVANSYAFGLWRRHLALDLCWYSVEFDNSERGLNIPSRRQTAFYAPSWSWASVTGRIKYDEDFQIDPETHRSKKIESQLLAIDVKCVPTAGNRFGNAEEGRLMVFGSLVPAKIQIPPADTSSTQVNGEPKRHYIVISTKESSNGSCPYDFLDPDVKGDGYEINPKDEHFVLLVAAEKGYRSRRGYCIVLKKVPGSTNEYQRVGFMRTNRSSPAEWKDTGKGMSMQGLTII